MNMTTLPAIISRAEDGTYSAYCKDEIFSGMGVTVEAAKADMAEQIRFYKQTALEEGFKYPEFLDGPYELEFTFEAVSLMKYYIEKGFLTIAGMSRLSGINKKQLWSYLNGSTPRKAQNDKIEKGLEHLSKDLKSIFA